MGDLSPHGGSLYIREAVDPLLVRHRGILVVGEGFIESLLEESLSGRAAKGG